MTKEMGFLIALCASSAVCYMLLTRADRIRAERRFARRGASTADGGDDSWSAGSSGFSLSSWFSGDTSCSGADSSGGSADFGGCNVSDSGGGGDCGGGGSSGD